MLNIVLFKVVDNKIVLNIIYLDIKFALFKDV